jgi:hypothetical protein
MYSALCHMSDALCLRPYVICLRPYLVFSGTRDHLLGALWLQEHQHRLMIAPLQMPAIAGLFYYKYRSKSATITG